VFDQHRPDSLLEELEAGRWIGGGILGPDQASEKDRQGGESERFHPGELP